MESSDLLRLVEVLGHEAELLEALYEVLKRQQDGLVESDIKMISDNVSRQIDILKEIESIEMERNNILSAIGKEVGAGIGLESLIESAPDYISRRLASLREGLREVVSQIRKVNEQNQLLIRQSLSYVQTMLKEIAGEDDACGYGADGKVGVKIREMVIDRRV